eukprot:TRINITY_DN2952_c1_g1_i3.p1 TRINITY_DN2952_c1_g1~~TRINITY_DN2952_c1_g1_i3.p1  ORF type:complete len:347 (-),score=26.00 TRINITY_DN2952_c1_g1_i3:172-1212(-)
MSLQVDVHLFLRVNGVILDVRTPEEYYNGHIPGALNLPLFENEERAKVGLCYKQRGREAAIELGLQCVGPKLVNMIQKAKQLAPQRKVCIYCWRGGMRSGSVSWLLQLAGFDVTTLKGGYKAFRRWACRSFSLPATINLLGGMTGCAKTEILQQLVELGEQVLDLEQLANHRGSSFGSLGMPEQPTSQHFSNKIALKWLEFDRQKPIWIEAEGSSIGTASVPQELFQQMQKAIITIEVVRTLEERIEHLIQLYGNQSIQDLILATDRIRKRLGGNKTDEAIKFIQQGDLRAAIRIVLYYYDKTYRYVLSEKSGVVHQVDVSTLDAQAAAKIIKQKFESLRMQSQEQ